MTLTYRRLRENESAEAASIHRAALDGALPWLAGRHTAEEDVRYFAQSVFKETMVWGAYADQLFGFVAIAPGWIEHLYVLPAVQGQGIGSKLLDIAKRDAESLELWTFEKNIGARRFYERHGFRAVRATEGDNMEREPDVLYLWTRP